METLPKIIVYGAAWCGDSRRARAVLERHKIDYEWIDIDLNAEARRRVETLNNGMRSVPTILFPDGSIMVEPADQELESKLGV